MYNVCDLISPQWCDVVITENCYKHVSKYELITENSYICFNTYNIALTCIVSQNYYATRLLSHLCELHKHCSLTKTELFINDVRRSLTTALNIVMKGYYYYYYL